MHAVVVPLWLVALWHATALMPHLHAVRKLLAVRRASQATGWGVQTIHLPFPALLGHSSPALLCSCRQFTRPALSSPPSGCLQVTDAVLAAAFQRFPTFQKAKASAGACAA